MANKAEAIAKKIPRVAHEQRPQPGRESKMAPRPQSDRNSYQGSGKLNGKVAIITGGDSGIGHAVAILYAKEGADIVIAYLNEHEDAKKVKDEIEALDRRCLLVAGDLGRETMCRTVVARTLKQFGRVDILVNNIAVQYPQQSIENIDQKQLLRTFATNVFSYFFMTKAALPHLKKGGVVINTTSVTAYKGSPTLLDYSSTRGAIVAFTRSLSQALIKQGIRVNAVAPGPIWTPLIPASFKEKRVKEFGQDVPMGRPGQPAEVAPCYVFLASDDSSYMAGQVLHPNGGTVVNG